MVGKEDIASCYTKVTLLCASSQGEYPYIEQSKANVEQHGGSVQISAGERAVQERFPGINGDLTNAREYFNYSCGWADAEGCIKYLAQQCASAEVSFVSGAYGKVTSLLVDADVFTGVKTPSGDVLHGDYFILATGAWSLHLIDIGGVSVSNAQPVAFLQLTPSEAEMLSKNPVIIDLSTGWFVFPPTPRTHILKLAGHGYGYEVAEAGSKAGQTSAPALDKDNAASSFVPQDTEKALRGGLSLFLPSLKDRPFVRRRLCWCTDTGKGDFIVDKHSSYMNLFMATGGSGQ